jgi:hypothetical protein
MSRTIPGPTIIALAQRLIGYVVAGGDPSAANTPAGFRVVEKLRRPLSRLAGVADFRSLMVRALMLAKARVPGLSPVQIMADGLLEGNLGSQDQAAEADVILIAQLLALLAVFIGESLMLSLVLHVWPDVGRSLCGDRRSASQAAHDCQDARRPTQQGHPRI